jgi:hypothetical protein
MNECEVHYFDASGFDLTPSISYAWQPSGNTNTITVNSSKSKRLNVIGFLNVKNNELTPYIFEESISSTLVCAIFNDFLESKLQKIKELSKITVVSNNRIKNDIKPQVIIDNASVHTSRVFTANIETWQSNCKINYLWLVKFNRWIKWK